MSGADVSEGLKPCAHCERELTHDAFRLPEAEYCQECEAALKEIFARKYSSVERALRRAQRRRRQRQD